MSHHLLRAIGIACALVLLAVCAALLVRRMNLRAPGDAARASGVGRTRATVRKRGRVRPPSSSSPATGPCRSSQGDLVVVVIAILVLCAVLLIVSRF